MADVFDEEKRSDIMRRVKSKKNKSTELRLIEMFKQNGIAGGGIILLRVIPILCFQRKGSQCL